jgi:hypothetical protein
MTVKIQFQSYHISHSAHHPWKKTCPTVGCGQTHTSGSDWDGEDLANNDPSTRSPGGSKEEDVDTDEGDLNLHNRGIVWHGRSDDGHNEFADKHTNSTVDQKGSSTESLNGPER